MLTSTPTSIDNKMPEKDPTSYSWVTYAWVFALSISGGIVSFIRKISRGETRPFNVVEFVGEIVASGLVGVITFWLCEGTSISPLITAALVGISGHMGSRALFLLEEVLKRKYGNV